MVTDQSTSEEVPVLKTNDDRALTLDGKFYPIKAFVPEDIYLGRLSKDFGGERREKKMGQSTKIDETSKNKNW